MRIVSIVPSGSSARALTRRERGWGEGQIAKQVHLHHTSEEGCHVSGGVGYLQTLETLRAVFMLSSFSSLFSWSGCSSPISLSRP